MEIVKLLIKDLEVNSGQIEGLPANPRQWSKDDVMKLANSLVQTPELFEMRPCIVYPFGKKYIILGGNMRYQASKQNLATEIPCIVVPKETSIEKLKEIVIKDNGSFGNWDYDELANRWDDLPLTEWGVPAWDVEEEEAEAKEDEDNLPELKESFIKNGDIVKMNNHRMICGDSCNESDIALLMNGEQSDLIFTDPPYDLEDNYSKIVVNQAKTDSHIFIMNGDKPLIQNIKNNEEFFRKMFFVDFRQAHLISNNQPMTRVDPIAEFCKGKTKFNNLFDGFSTLIECAKIHNNNEEQNFGFNQAKKVELPETFILHYSNENELVCDFFGGSGSTLIACEKNNRKCYINEFDPSHCDIIMKRWILYMKEHSKPFEIEINNVKLSEDDIEKITS